ncbi:transaldolase [Microbispora sp. KK1-11]|uniref:transaldolase n=1 Tax=Microbispora sp. KK1-11 TaxID=2053005 RepID=UPI00115B0650|nr:transaldolase [Microbispora sp. KK1-11]TQS29726.1 transaldolase [Microbispora sp. KK1-11]
MNENLKRLTDAGVSIWLDDISRERLRSGNLAALIRDKNVTGVTSNPTIFASALSKGDAYDAQLRDLATRGVTVEEAVRAITTFDIRWAADVLRPVFDATRGVDGRVSIEVDPRLARRTEATIAEARALWWLVDRPNVHIKIPATVEGLPAITQAISEGISVNVTLIFSLERYRQVMDAWLSGLEKAKANGLNLATIESVASFFVSRVDSEIDKRLDKIGTPEAAELKGKAAVANARLAFAAYEEVMNSPRWQALRAAGAHPQRPLWASTGVKNPDYPDTLYVEQLVTAGVVNTMPEKTLDAVADHGRISGDTIRPFYQQAWDVMASLKQTGIDYDDVVRALEEEGVEKFETSWSELLETVDGELRKA